MRVYVKSKYNQEQWEELLADAIDAAITEYEVNFIEMIDVKYNQVKWSEFSLDVKALKKVERLAQGLGGYGDED